MEDSLQHHNRITYSLRLSEAIIQLGRLFKKGLLIFTTSVLLPDKTLNGQLLSDIR